MVDQRRRFASIGAHSSDKSVLANDNFRRDESGSNQGSAEFLRGRNLEYIRAARALGLSNAKIMYKHLLPNAMVSTMTFLPFVVSGSITSLTALDFLGLGLPPGSPSLGELLLQGKSNLQAPWLGLTAFFSLAFVLSLLNFIGEAVRDALDPRKTFQ